MPLTIMNMGKNYIGADYYLLPFTVGRLFGTSEVLYFMVDTGLTGTLLTPEANEYLMPLPMQNTVEGAFFRGSGGGRRTTAARRSYRARGPKSAAGVLEHGFWFAFRSRPPGTVGPNARLSARCCSKTVAEGGPAAAAAGSRSRCRCCRGRGVPRFVLPAVPPRAFGCPKR